MSNSPDVPDRPPEHKHSVIPLSPTTTFYPRTLPSPIPWAGGESGVDSSPSIYGPTPLLPSHTLFPPAHPHTPVPSNTKSPHAPPRPPRPDDAAVATPAFSYNQHGWSAPFPSTQAANKSTPDLSKPTSSPESSPPRPLRPPPHNSGLLFDAVRSGGLRPLATPEPEASRLSNSTLDSVELDLATSVVLTNPGSTKASPKLDDSPPVPPLPQEYSPPRTTSAPLSILDFQALLTPPTPATSLFPSTTPLSALTTSSPLTAAEKGKGRAVSPRVPSPSLTTTFAPLPPSTSHHPSTLPSSHEHVPQHDRIDITGWERRDSARSLALQADRERDKLARVRALRPDRESRVSSLGGAELGLGLRRRSSVAMVDSADWVAQAEARTQSRQNKARRREAQIIQIHPEEKIDEIEGELEVEEEEEATLRMARLNFATIEYAGWFPRLVHMIFPLFVIFHYPATLFLDYNVLYTLVQLALDPSLPTTSSNLNSSDFVPRDTIAVPTLRTSTAFWVAVGLYALCTFLWGTVVCLWLDLGRGYLSLWERGGQVQIGRVYANSAAFNFACMRSFSDFSFMYRVRLAPFQRKSYIRVAGTTFGDGFLDTCSWYSQNWPTLLLLLPRAGLSLAVLLLYSTTAYGSADLTPMKRDGGYFQRNGTLTGFASGVLLANLAWAAFRLLVVLIAAIGLFFGRSSRSDPLVTPTLPQEFRSPETFYSSKSTTRARATDFRTRRTRRVRAAILLAQTPDYRSGFTPRPFQATPSGTPINFDAKLDRDDRREERRRKRLARRDELDAAAFQEVAPPPSRAGASPGHHRSGSSSWKGLAPYVSPAPAAIYSPGRVRAPGGEGFVSPPVELSPLSGTPEAFLNVPVEDEAPVEEEAPVGAEEAAIEEAAAQDDTPMDDDADRRRRHFRVQNFRHPWLASSFSSVSTAPPTEDPGSPEELQIAHLAPLASVSPSITQVGQESPVVGSLSVLPPVLPPFSIASDAVQLRTPIPHSSPLFPSTPQLAYDSTASSPEILLATPGSIPSRFPFVPFTSTSLSAPSTTSLYSLQPHLRGSSLNFRKLTLIPPFSGRGSDLHLDNSTPEDVRDARNAPLPDLPKPVHVRDSPETSPTISRLLDQVQRQEEAAAVRWERERRQAHLSRLSEATSRLSEATSRDSDSVTQAYLSLSAAEVDGGSAPTQTTTRNTNVDAPPQHPGLAPPFRLSLLAGRPESQAFNFDYLESTEDEDEDGDHLVEADDVRTASRGSAGSERSRSTTPTSSARKVKRRPMPTIYQSPGGETFGGRGFGFDSSDASPRFEDSP